MMFLQEWLSRISNGCSDNDNRDMLQFVVEPKILSLGMFLIVCKKCKIGCFIFELLRNSVCCSIFIC